MDRTWRRWLGRFADGLPEARYEAVLALTRTSLCLTSGLALLLQADPHTDLVLPAVMNIGIGVASLVVAGLLGKVSSPEGARRYGRWSTAADLTLYAAYAAAFASRPGAGALYAVFVLLVGPIRYGARGLLVTVAPVAAVSVVWPQLDVTGAHGPRLQVVLLCAIFALPALIVRAVVTRGSARLRQAEQQFATAFEHASIGMALTDLDLQILQANRSMGVLLGESAGTLVGGRLDAAVDLLDRQRLQSALRSLSSTRPSMRLEVRLRRPDGGLRWGHVAASQLAGSPGVPARIVVQIENITERKRSEAMLSHAAAHDSLTDLPNRSLMLARLEAALAHGEQVGVLFLDLDRFKVVNDDLGHAVGDALLVQLAGRLREVMRPDDLVARLGGDEFVVLCRSADVQTALAVAARVSDVLSYPIAAGGRGDLVVGASIGIAVGGSGDTAERLLRDADTAMYAAKSAGGGRCRVFTPDLREAVVRAHALEVDLRAAVRAGDLAVVYQPLIDLALGTVLGCEALVRWNHPQRGAVSPQEFVAVAEQSDLILELGEWVLRQALHDVAAWPPSDTGYAPSVSVNVSLRQLLSVDFADRVADIVAEIGTDPARLCLEVTETVLAGDVTPVIVILEALRAKGFRLSIDDFGTGHASLTYLARFPVDQVKVDQSFVAGLSLDAGSAAIVGGVIAMAHTFDLRVIAEGVETESQLTALRGLGCDAVQGFLLSRPLAQQDLLVALARNAANRLLPVPREEVATELRLDEGGDEQRRYRLLVEGAKEVTGRLDLASVLEHAFTALARAVTFTGGSIQLVENDQVRIAAGMPAPSAEAQAARIPLGHGVSGTIAVTGEPRYLPDITIASTVTATRRSSASSGVRSWYGVPLISEGRPIGVLQVDSTEVDAFSESDRLAVLSFASVVALAVVCARRSEEQLRAIQQSGRQS